MVAVSAPKKRMIASKARPKARAIPRAKPLTKEEKRSQYFHKAKQLAIMTATTAAMSAPIGLKTAPHNRGFV